MSAFVVHTAAPGDARILTEARRHMFEDMGETNAESLDTADAAFEGWVRAALADGTAIGYIARSADGEWVGAVTAHVQRVPPSMGNPVGIQHYLLGLWVEPEARRQGVATAMVEAAVERAKMDGAGAVSLMATDDGRRVYERIGFEPAPSMRLFLEPLP